MVQGRPPLVHGRQQLLIAHSSTSRNFDAVLDFAWSS